MYLSYLSITHTALHTPPPQAFLLYNPGLGHPALSKDWTPTLKAIEKTVGAASPSSSGGSKVIWTAHSEKDRDSDLKALESLGGIEWLVPAEANPFASRRKLAGPLDTSHILAANRYVGVFRFK